MVGDAPAGRDVPAREMEVDHEGAGGGPGASGGAAYAGDGCGDRKPPAGAGRTERALVRPSARVRRYLEDPPREVHLGHMPYPQASDHLQCRARPRAAGAGGVRGRSRAHASSGGEPRSALLCVDGRATARLEAPPPET